MYTHVSVYAFKAINDCSGVILTLHDWLNNCGCFSVPFIALAIDVINRCGPSNELHHQLQPKKTKARLY